MIFSARIETKRKKVTKQKTPFSTEYNESGIRCCIKCGKPKTSNQRVDTVSIWEESESFCFPCYAQLIGFSKYWYKLREKMFQ